MVTRGCSIGGGQFLRLLTHFLYLVLPLYVVYLVLAVLQSKLLSSVTLVDKYGHEGLWHRMTRFESKQQVVAKFSGLQQELHDISSNVSSSSGSSNSRRRGDAALRSARSLAWCIVHDACIARRLLNV